MIFIEIVFWISFFSLLHTYIIYPLLLRVLALSVSPVLYTSCSKEIYKHGNMKADGTSILISAYNEEKIITEKIESIFNSDYPREKIEVLVGSDASTDKTNELVNILSQKYSNVHLISFPSRSGKIKIINHLKSIAVNELLIITDANVIFGRDTIHELVKHFSNPEIALVDSHIINTSCGIFDKTNSEKKESGIPKAESTYIRREVEIKNYEGKVFGMMIGPFGGCYAVRKSFCENVPENFLVDDFYINMKVLEKGGKAISEINARVYEDIPSDWNVEFKRKIRIATGSFQNLFAFFPVLLKFNTLSFCFFSHKVLRWLGPFFMIGFYLTDFLIILRITHEYHVRELQIEKYLIFFVFQNFILVILILDLFLSALKIYFPMTRLVTHFLSTNLALLIGFFKFLKGVKSSVWQPTKR